LSEAEEWLAGEPEPPVSFDVGLDGARLAGVLRGVRPKGQALVRFARLKPKNELAAWAQHLALCAARPTGSFRTTLVLGRARNDDARVEGRVFEPLDEARAKRHLGELARLYRLGQRSPLCLFPNASKVFAERFGAAADRPDRERSALWMARKAFTDRSAGAEADDAYVRRIFASVDPLAAGPSPFDPTGEAGLPTFAEVSLLVFAPLLASSRAVQP
jgi:exodeoxyribonuclease V gamma subunit